MRSLDRDFVTLVVSTSGPPIKELSELLLTGAGPLLSQVPMGAGGTAASNSRLG